MSVFGRFMEVFNGKSSRFKEMENEYRMQKKLEERQMSSNERELRKFQKKAREERIRRELDRYRKVEEKKWANDNPMTNVKHFAKQKNPITHGVQRR